MAKQVKILHVKNPRRRNRLDVINDETQKPVIPVGPPFQAKIPDWTGPPSSEYYSDNSLTKWLGVRVWPIEDKHSQTKVEAVGKGKPNTCSCASPGSIECVKRHVNDKRLNLQYELGPAFWGWKFDEMGEDVSKLWNLEEQKEFDAIVKKSCSQGNNFLEIALEQFQTKSRENIVSYYFNVYVPRRMKIQTRSGCEMIDTDDEENGEAYRLESSRKRYRNDGAKATSGKHVKNNYLKRR